MQERISGGSAKGCVSRRNPAASWRADRRQVMSERSRGTGEDLRFLFQESILKGIVEQGVDVPESSFDEVDCE